MIKWIRGVAFLCVTAILIAGTYRVLSWKDTTGDYVSSVQMLYNTEENLIDVVFVGSSHVYAGVNVALLWEQYGMSAFDMAVSGQDKDSAYHNLVEVLKTQSPQVVCVDMYALTFDGHEIQGNIYRNMLSMDISQNSIELVQEYIDEEEQQDYILRWPIIHTRYRELKRYDFDTYDRNLFGRGESMNWNVGWAQEVSWEILSDSSENPLSEKNREWLEKLAALAEEEEFELVFFLAPFYCDDPDIRRMFNAARLLPTVKIFPSWISTSWRER